MCIRDREYYVKDVAPALMKKFSYKSVMQIPKLDKIVINVSCGEARDNAKVIEAIVADLSAITGQRPVVCKMSIRDSRKGFSQIFKKIQRKPLLFAFR